MVKHKSKNSTPWTNLLPQALELHLTSCCPSTVKHLKRVLYITVSIFSDVFSNHSGVTSILITLWKLLSKGSLMTFVIKSSGKCPAIILCDLSVTFNSVYQITSPKRVFHGLVERCALCGSLWSPSHARWDLGLSDLSPLLNQYALTESHPGSSH